MGRQPDVRVGDAERSIAVAALVEHTAAGRLTIAEFDTRAGQAWAAGTHGDLDRLFADLPPLAVELPRRRWRVPHPVLVVAAATAVVLLLAGAGWVMPGAAAAMMAACM